MGSSLGRGLAALCGGWWSPVRRGRSAPGRGGLDVDQELRWTFLASLAAAGTADESVIAAELA
ncbi:hypothetical protein, partial [Streptomyces sp. NPDC048636]|uniref:hypothetical protein n=1 Tax=Streptomyces sp. NPDC048636 TaxID=3155762 RepID=UPI003430381F